jgi:hypothetical protein
MTDRPVAADTPFVVRSSDRVSIVRVGDVQWIESAGNYVGVHTSCGRLLTRETMAHIAARFRSYRRNALPIYHLACPFGCSGTGRREELARFLTFFAFLPACAAR